MESVFGSCEGRSRWTQPWLLWNVAACVAGLVALWVFTHEKPSSPSRIVLGFLPAILWIACVVALVRRVRRLDEMGRRLQMEAASIAFVATVLLTFVSMGLTAAKIYTVEAVIPGMAGIVIWAAATAFLARGYQ